eukprot:238802-Pleurochrysis_carterae.AAC.2
MKASDTDKYGQSPKAATVTTSANSERQGARRWVSGVEAIDAEGERDAASTGCAIECALYGLLPHTLRSANHGQQRLGELRQQWPM